MATRSPPNGHIDLWLVFLHEVPDSLLAEYRALLNEEERRQELRFHFERDRRRYVVTRALVRTVLSRYRDVDPRAWRFEKNQYGRPEVTNLGASQPPIYFNLSHTPGLIVCGVAASACLGVDTEAVDRERSALAIADRYFSPQEVAQLRSAPTKSQVSLFFQYWTLKESYIKAQGIGLSLPLDQFSFDLSRQGEVTISFHAPLQDDPRRLCFWLLKPTENHLLAVCLGRHEKADACLVIRRTVPLVSEELVRYPVLRISPGLTSAELLHAPTDINPF